MTGPWAIFPSIGRAKLTDTKKKIINWLAVAAFGITCGAASRSVDTLPGHNHFGHGMRLDCNGCGQTLMQFVKAQVASIGSKS